MWFLSSIVAKLDAIIANQRIIRANQHKISENQQSIALQLSRAFGLLDDVLFRLGPGQISIAVTGERRSENMDLIQFKVNLPPKSAGDVKGRELSVTIGDSEPVIRNLGANTNVVEGLEGPQDATVVLALTDIDDSGNRSEVSTLETVLLDTFAPAKPGDLGVQLVGERTVPDPVDPEPTNPIDPVDPEPTNPADPVDPEPTNPIDPVDPEPTNQG